jgi:UDP-glucose 4-epimerase
MKTFVVTGASGYIGSHMCYELRQAYPDCYIVGVDKKQKHKLSRLYDDFLLYDISRTNFGVFDKYKTDCVFHFAAYASVPEGESNRWDYYRNNLAGSLKIIDEAISYGVKNFIFSSTCAVYGYTDKKICESRSKNPSSVYAKTKSIIEDVLIAADEEKRLNAGILRYFNAAGRNVVADLHEEHEPETHLIPNLVKKESIDVYGTDFDTRDGTAVRDYIHVIDICRAHIRAYEYMRENNKGIITNIGTGRGYSVLEVIEVVEKITGRKLNINYHDRRAGDVDYLVSDVKNMKRLLNFTPEHDIVSIVKSMRN